MFSRDSLLFWRELGDVRVPPPYHVVEEQVIDLAMHLTAIIPRHDHYACRLKYHKPWTQRTFVYA